MAYKLTIKFSKITVWKVMQTNIFFKKNLINKRNSCNRNDFKRNMNKFKIKNNI